MRTARRLFSPGTSSDRYVPPHRDDVRYRKRRSVAPERHASSAPPTTSIPLPSVQPSPLPPGTLPPRPVDPPPPGTSLTCPEPFDLPLTLNAHGHPLLNPTVQHEPGGWPEFYTSRALSPLPWDEPGSSSLAPLRHPARLTVARGEYENVVAALAGSTPVVALVVGPTSCGKTTYCLLRVMAADLTVLLVQPSGPNISSAMNEFLNKIPRQLARERTGDLAPIVAHNSFLSLVDSPAQLNICDSQDLLIYFYQYGTFPPVDVIFLDEYHLTRRAHVLCRALLENVLTDRKSVV